MAMSVEDLAKRLKDIPQNAGLYWYTGGDRVRLQAEWHEGPGDFRSIVVASFTAFHTGGPVE